MQLVVLDLQTQCRSCGFKSTLSHSRLRMSLPYFIQFSLVPHSHPSSLYRFLVIPSSNLQLPSYSLDTTMPCPTQQHSTPPNTSSPQPPAPPRLSIRDEILQEYATTTPDMSFFGKWSRKCTFHPFHYYNLSAHDKLIHNKGT
jgi:hypothetical protein